MAEYDILIRGGTIVDGTRTPRYVSDIGIKDGKIAQIGGLKGKTADRVLDAAGRIVAPGFVDLHTHYDAQIFWDPYCTLSGWHGVTSVALGNCGFGFAPSRVEDRDRAMLSMTRNEAIPYDAMKAGMPWDWVTFPDFIESLDPHAQRRQLSHLRPVDPTVCVGNGLGRSEEAAADRSGTPGNVSVDPRGDGCRGVWLVGSGPGSEVHPT